MDVCMIISEGEIWNFSVNTCMHALAFAYISTYMFFFYEIDLISTYIPWIYIRTK